MKTPFINRILVILSMMFVVELAHAGSFNFLIKQGEVTSTPSRCLPENCPAQSSALMGTFIAVIDGDDLFIKSSNVSSELGEFVLPKSPNSEANGTVLSAKFSFSDNTMTIVGSIDSRAFDGPLQEYSIVATIIPETSPQFDPLGYYQIRQDFRKCVSPTCGGIFATKVNTKRMYCPDGTWAKECYIGTVKWDAIGGSPFSASSTPIVKGRITEDSDLGSEFGVFTAEAAYRPANEKAKRQKVFALNNNGIVCITSPCFSYDEYVINRKHQRKISGYDFSRVKASKKDLDMATSILAEGKTLLVAGQHRHPRHFNFRGDTNRGITLIATQFYLPISNTPFSEKCEEGYIMTDFGCATKYGCFYPQLELTTIGGALMIDPKTGDSVSNVTYSCVDACEFPAEAIGSGRCVLNLP